MKKFNITVIINAVELLMNNFDIKEEAKNIFSSVEYYCDTLMDEMSEDGIFEEYVDMFGCADPEVLFDNYVTVDVDNVEYNFDEDAADGGQHRDCCFFRVPCSFDLEKYIKYMDQANNEDSGEDDEIGITVYRETISSDLAGDDNLGTLIIKKDMLMKYFKERILPDFRGDDKTVSDEGLLQEWLDEYTADETTDLYDFIQLEEKRAKDKEHYQKLYDEKYDKLLEQAKNDRELEFCLPEAMTAYLESGDLYNPITETFVSQYSDKGHIIVYTGIDVKRARQLADETYHAGEKSWTSVIGPGGAIYEKDFPFNSAADSWIRDNFSKNGWVVADTDTFSNENKIFIHHAWDFDPIDWIVGISGSDMDDVEVKVVHGTTYQLKKQLISEIQNIIADGNPDDWDSRTEEADEIIMHDDGKLYAYVCFKDCHFDLTATPISVASHIDLSGVC